MMMMRMVMIDMSPPFHRLQNVRVVRDHLPPERLLRTFWRRMGDGAGVYSRKCG
jgi:hypothetical protein